MHISALARELGISVPVTLRHVGLLESADLIEKKQFGSTHVFAIRKDAEGKLERVMDLMDESHVVKIKKGENLANALTKVPGIKIEKTKDGAFVSSVDKQSGYFIYEVNNELVSKSPDKIKITKDSVIELKRLAPVIGKKISIKIE